MRLVKRLAIFGGLALGAAMLAAGPAGAASSCAPSGVSTLCTVDAQNATDLNGFNQSYATGLSFAANSTYVLTVQNPQTTTWTYSNNQPSPPYVTADGLSGGLSTAALIGQIGNGPGTTGAFNISTLGSLAVGGATTGTVNIGLGGTAAYTAGQSLSLAMLDTDTFNNSGTQSVLITKAPTVGGNVLANLNVFAAANSLDATPAASGVTLLATHTYQVSVTDPTHLWAAGTSLSRESTAAGIDPVASGFGLCGVAQGCGTDASQFGAGEPTAFNYGELVAVIGGKYYGVGTGRSFSNVSGAISFVFWDSFGLDNLGAMNVTIVDPPPGQVPEPASLTLIGSGLAGLALLRRRRRAA